MGRYLKFMMAFFLVQARPYRWVLEKLIKLTGWSSTFWSRIAAHTTALVFVAEITYSVVEKSWLEAGMALFILLWTLPWALKRIDKIERWIEAGDSASGFPLTEKELWDVVWWSNIYGFFGIVFFGMLFLDGDPWPIRCVMMAVTGSWMTVLHPGGKKEKARAWKLAPVGGGV